MPYRGLGSGIIRALQEEPNIKFINEPVGMQFISVINRIADEGVNEGEGINEGINEGTKIRKRVLFSYACYETLSLTTYNTGNGKFDELSQKKNAAICDVSITLYKQKRENFIPPFRRCWLPLFLLQ